MDSMNRSGRGAPRGGRLRGRGNPRFHPSGNDFPSQNTNDEFNYTNIGEFVPSTEFSAHQAQYHNYQKEPKVAPNSSQGRNRSAGERRKASSSTNSSSLPQRSGKSRGGNGAPTGAFGGGDNEPDGGNDGAAGGLRSGSHTNNMKSARSSGHSDKRGRTGNKNTISTQK